MEITLFWSDKNWKAKGAADNVWLHIYPDKETYKIYKSPYCDTSLRSTVEVNRKSDIEDMIKYLDSEGYQMED